MSLIRRRSAAPPSPEIGGRKSVKIIKYVGKAREAEKLADRTLAAAVLRMLGGRG